VVNQLLAELLTDT